MSEIRNLELPTLVLASTSPRRKQLLESLGIPFTVRVPDADEVTGAGSEAEAVALRNAVTKARSIESTLGTGSIAIGADTVVVSGSELLGKPGTPEEARAFLRRLSGRPHGVITGLYLYSDRAERRVVARSTVHFRRLAEDEIESYTATREPYDKAGGYAVQGLGALFIERIEGSYSNVMGFPIEAFLKELEAISGIPLARWFR